MKLGIITGLVLFMGACCATPTPKVAEGFDPIALAGSDEFCADMVYVHYAGLTKDQEQLFGEAFAVWSKSTGIRICRQLFPRPGVVRELRVQVADSGPGELCGQYSSQYDLIVLYRSCRVSGPYWERLVMIHELGHALGLGHTEDTSVVSVMHKFINRDTLEGGFIPKYDRVRWYRRAK